MKEMAGNNTYKQSPLLIVELVGPAGAGKTTLSRHLIQRSEKIQVGADIELRRLKYIPVFLHNVLLSLPIILRQCWRGRWFTWDEIKALVYLRAWAKVLRRPVGKMGRVTLLDHGPIFKLATLNEFGPERLKTESFEIWWNNMIGHWASTLDIVIWLDAPDSILEERINSRNQRHLVKGKTEEEVSQFLARYRRSYKQILSKLTAFEGPTLFHFDTSKANIEQIVDEILLTVNVTSWQD